jgi:cellulose synthase/poly-beta-1,6-N-acetylglucosamine synthase-like glycosyltransferase
MTNRTELTMTLPAAMPERAAALPFVSIVIPVKNDAARLAVCLASLAETDYPIDRYEIIVVDNGSTDESREVARQHEVVVLSHPDLRVGALRNRGVAIAQGDVLAFIDSDHEAPADWLRRGAHEFAATEERRMVGSPCLGPVQGTWVQRYWELHRLRDQSRQQASWLGAGNMFLRRSDFERLGGFREDLVATEDVDLCVRFTESGGTIISDPALANIHHGEPPTLRQFCRKEFWRGSSNLRGFFSHGMPLHELPSLLFPVWHAAALVALAAAIIVAFALGTLLYAGLALLALLAPALVLAAHTSWKTSRPRAVLPLAALYLAYGIVRAAALFKG